MPGGRYSQKLPHEAWHRLGIEMLVVACSFLDTRSPNGKSEAMQNHGQRLTMIYVTGFGRGRRASSKPKKLEASLNEAISTSISYFWRLKRLGLKIDLRGVLRTRDFLKA